MEQQALLAKRTFESVTKLRVTHAIASCEIGYGTMSSMTRGEDREAGATSGRGRTTPELTADGSRRRRAGVDENLWP
jgi:hypothetical protein